MTSTTQAVPTFLCDVCSQTHDIPLNMGFSEPDFVNKLLPWEKEKRCQLSPDWCIVDEELFYLRGCLQVPIQGTQHVFSWGIWTTLDVDDFDTTMERWEDPARVSEPPYVGSLANTLPTYTETRNLAVLVQTRQPGDRPLLTVTDDGHKLFHEQKDGMTMERAIELAKLVLHGGTSNQWGHLCER